MTPDPQPIYGFWTLVGPCRVVHLFSYSNIWIMDNIHIIDILASGPKLS